MNPKVRVHYIPAAQFFNLNACCASLLTAYGDVAYLVGSATERPDFRDVDVCMIMANEDFDARFPGEGVPTNHNLSMLWCITCVSIGLWLSGQTGLAVDFKIQRRTQANENHDKPRHPLGLSMGPNPADYAHTIAVNLGSSAPSSPPKIPDLDVKPPCSEQ